MPEGPKPFDIAESIQNAIWQIENQPWLPPYQQIVLHPKQLEELKYRQFFGEMQERIHSAMMEYRWYRIKFKIQEWRDRYVR